MIKYFPIITFIILSSCSFMSSNKDENEALDNDSCKNAVKFPNAVLTEKTITSNFTGDLNNYWGEDTTKLDIKHTFKNGELVQSRFYYENGQVQEEYHFKCQSLHGLVKYFYENGNIAQIIPFRYGRRNGTGLIFDTLGKIRQKVIFENDSMIQGPVDYDEKGREIKN